MCALLLLLVAPVWSRMDGDVILRTRHLEYAIAADGRNLRFVDRRTNHDFLHPESASRFAVATVNGAPVEASACSLEGGRLRVRFGDKAGAVLRVEQKPDYLVFTVEAVEGEGVDALEFARTHLKLKGEDGEPFTACTLALNLRTNVPELPRPNALTRALCYKKTGMIGASAALVASPPASLRRVLQRVVTEAPELPKSPLGGPFALGQPITQGSYLFNFGDLSEKTVDRWIALAKSLGMTQINFHGGTSFRFGDCLPNPETYPHGLKSMRAVIDRLHAAGIQAGFHTYAFFIDKRTPWVTPVPDRRLASDAVFTLAAPLDADTASVMVRETTERMSAVTGFFVRNSVTLRIEDELITYTGVSKTEPFGFTGCVRGAYGTRRSAHPAGAKVYHLKECFGLFVPDPETTLLEEVAEANARAYNEAGFDMVYLDALDGEDVLGGTEWGWHYGTRFVFELFKRMKKPPLMEMSTFRHHLWYVRSRLGAWDHPTRSHKAFIDLHVQANEENRRMFMPGQLGWWALKTWTGAQGEPTFSDDMEYLLARCIGTEVGFALMGIDPETAGSIPALPRLAEIVRKYETVRHGGKVSPAMKARLRQPGAEFRLVDANPGRPRFAPVARMRHRVEGPEEPSAAWEFTNPYGAQTPTVRLEALLSVERPSGQNNTVLLDGNLLGAFANRGAAPGVRLELRPAEQQTPDGEPTVAVASSNKTATREGSWSYAERVFEPPLDLSAKQGVGFWLHGDGSGAVLNIQMRCPPHLVAGIGDRYVVVDFKGWRYVELVETEGERHGRYRWPYGDPYSIYREVLQFGQIERVSIWLNNVPANGTTNILLGPVRALPLAVGEIVNPAIENEGGAWRFPARLRSGQYLEVEPNGSGAVYGEKGELLASFKAEGAALRLTVGRSQLRFRCDGSARPRARVTLATEGRPL